MYSKKETLFQRHRLLQIAKNPVHLFDVLVREFLELQGMNHQHLPN